MVDLEELATAHTAFEDQEYCSVLIALEHPFHPLPDANVGHAAVAEGSAADVQEQMFPHLHPGQPFTFLNCMLLFIIPAYSY
jgi:hypothetical protein